MHKSESLSPIRRIAEFTIADELQQKSITVTFFICALLIFLMRGCYQGNYVINGQALGEEVIAWQVSRVIFHVITAGAMLTAALLVMRIFSRDREAGIQACILSKPIDRRQYILGKVLGLWFLSFLFMFILHGIVFVIASLQTHTPAFSILAASLICSFNLLFVVLAVLLLSLHVADIAAFLFTTGIIVAGWVADVIFHLSQSGLAQASMPQHGAPALSGITWQKVLYYAWPKVWGVEQWASSFVGIGDLRGMETGSLYPVANILCYLIILWFLLYQRFKNEDIG